MAGIAGRRRGPWTWLSLIALGGVSCFLGAQGLRDFLELNSPLRKGALVVEAWLPSTALAQVPAVVKSGRYRKILVVGNGRSESGNDVGTAVRELTRFGLDPGAMVGLGVPPEATQQLLVLPIFLGPGSFRVAVFRSSRRTYAGAVAVRKWLHREAPGLVAIDVFTLGVHARKSRLLMQHALGGRYRVGVIPARSVDYDFWSWPLSKNGRRLVLRNIAGYVYFKTLVALGWIGSGRTLSAAAQGDINHR